MRRLRIVAVTAGVALALFAVWWALIHFGPAEFKFSAVFFPAASILLTVSQLARLLNRPPAPPEDESSVSKRYVVPRTLPPAPLLVGRDRDIAEIKQHLLDPAEPQASRIAMIYGDPGIGKTALAVVTARQIMSRFPGGVLFAGVGSTDPDMIMREFVAALEGPDVRLPGDREGLARAYRELTFRPGRQVLVVLDDCSDTDVVERLKPAGPHCAVILTSRRKLRVPGAWAPEHGLQPLGRDDAMRLLEALVGERVAAEREIAERVIDHTQRSPLALNLIGSSLANRPNWTLRAAVEHLDLTGPVQAGAGSPATSLDASMALLPEEERNAVLVLGLLESRTFEPWVLAALLNMQAGNERQAWRLCDRLVHARLVEHLVDDSTGVAEYRVLEHVHDYAKANVRTDPARREQAVQRVDIRRTQRGERDLGKLLRLNVYPGLERGTLSSAINNARGVLAQARTNLKRTKAGSPEAKQARADEGLALAALAEVTAELGSLDEAADMALSARSAEGPAVLPRALRVIGGVQRRQHRLVEANLSLRSALEAADSIDYASERVRVRREIALLRADQGWRSEALDEIDRAYVALEDSRSGSRLRPHLLWAHASVLLTLVDRHNQLDLIDDASKVLRDAAEAGREQALWQAWTGHHQAWADRLMHRFERSRIAALRASEEFARMRHRYGMARCRLQVAIYCLEQGQPQAALALLEEARHTFSFCGDRRTEAETALLLAQTQLEDGRIGDAVRELNLATNIYTDLEDQQGLDRATRLAERATAPAMGARAAHVAVAAPPGGFLTPHLSTGGGR